MIYFSDMDMPRERFDHEQWQRLNDFRTLCMARGLIQTYASHLEFKDRFTQQLAMVMNRWPQALAHKAKANQDPLSWLPNTLPDIKKSLLERKRDGLSAEARELLLGAAVDSHGQILRAETKDGLEIVTNGKNHVPALRPRERVRWDAALSELWTASLLKVITHDEVYEVTDEGYQMADLLRMDLLDR
jgi:hypothetical protein